MHAAPAVTSPAEAETFQQEYRAALTQAAATLDLSGADTVLTHWWGIATPSKNSCDESVPVNAAIGQWLTSDRIGRGLILYSFRPGGPRLVVLRLVYWRCTGTHSRGAARKPKTSSVRAAHPGDSSAPSAQEHLSSVARMGHPNVPPQAPTCQLTGTPLTTPMSTDNPWPVRCLAAGTNAGDQALNRCRAWDETD